MVVLFFALIFTVDFIHLIGPFPKSIDYLPNPEDYERGYTTVRYETAREYVQNRALPTSLFTWGICLFISQLDWILLKLKGE